MANRKYRRAAIPADEREKMTEIRKSVVTAENLGSGKKNPASLPGGSKIKVEDEEEKKPKLRVVENKAKKPAKEEPELVEPEPIMEEPEDGKKLSLSKIAFGDDPAGLTTDELAYTHFELHKAWRSALKSEGERPSSVEMANMHALVVDELYKRGVEHPSPPGFWLDDVSKDLEAFGEEQPDSNKEPELKVRKVKAKEDGTLAIRKKIDPYEAIPSGEEPMPYALCKRWVGKSVELSLLLGLRKERAAIGWKLGQAAEGASPEPVISVSKAKDEHEKGSQDDNEVGIEQAISVPISCSKLGVIPYAWLNIEARTTAPESGEVEPLGSDGENPAVYHIVEKGEMEYGAQTEELHEYFLKSEGDIYRIVFKTSKDGWTAEVKADPSPYVLSEEAVEKGWMPANGHSALPIILKSQIPEVHRYWENDKEGRSQRYELCKSIAEGEFKLDFDAIDEEAMEKARVELHKRAEVGVSILKLKKKGERQLITGIVLEPDEIDAHNDTIKSEVIEEAAFNFLSNYNKSTKLGVMHKIFGLNGMELVESWIAKSDHKLNDKPVKKGSWLITVKVTDDQLWKKIKKGEITGFSIGGSALVRQS